jgi:diketogulonate reductase-like aldo/keto reductase
MPLNTTRREFLARLSGLGVLCSLPFEIPAKENLPQRPIPGSDEMLPVIGLGSTKPVRQIPTAGTEPLENVIRMLMSFGGTVVDTSPRPESIDAEFGRLLEIPDFRDQLFIAAKVKTSGKEAGIAQFRQTQRLFGRRTLDLVQIESLTDLDTHWPSLREWQDAGEARYIGVTVSHEEKYQTLESFMRRESPDFVQLNYSVMETSAEEKLLPLAEERGIAVLVNGPFMNGDYFGLVSGHQLPDWAGEFDCTSWAQFSLKYILAHPVVTCVLTETTNPGHMRDNIQAAFGSLPDDIMKRHMREFARSF